MTHASVDRRTANLVGAFALAVTDAVTSETAFLFGPTGSAASALLLVHHHHIRRLDDLCAPLALTHAAVVRLVDRLEEDGYVRRRVNTDDRREVALDLTAAGRARVAETLGARERAVATALGSLTKSQVDHLREAAEAALAGITATADSPARICRMCDEHGCDLLRCPVELTANAGGA